MGKQTRTSKTAIAGALLLAAGLLAGCQAEPERNDAGSIAEEGDLSVFRFRVGDCFNDPGTDEVTDVDAVPCSSPHDNEVFYMFDLPDGDFPGDAAMEEAFADRCLPEFASYVGTPYETSELYMFPVTPTAESWAQDDREVVCVIYADGSQLTGSIKGSGR